MINKIEITLVVIILLIYPIYGQSSITITGTATMEVTTPTVSQIPFVTSDSFVDENSGLQFTVSGGTNNKSDAYSATPVPVELVSYTAVVVDDSVKLFWETATEVNNYGFEVQRTAVGQISNLSPIWETLGFVLGHGNSNSPKYYQFVDAKRCVDSAEYRLKQIDTDGVFEYYSQTIVVEGYNATDVIEEILPTEFKLEQNYPNPFNPSTVISYAIIETRFVSLIVYNSIGQEVAALVKQKQNAGSYDLVFNASNLPSGIYFYSINAGEYSSVKKMMLLK